jgi:hypothetical protein
VGVGGQIDAPQVSICPPNLNNRLYLEERIATIKAQTLTDWKLVVCDNFPDDGARGGLAKARAISLDAVIRASSGLRGIPCMFTERTGTGRYSDLTILILMDYSNQTSLLLPKIPA